MPIRTHTFAGKVYRTMTDGRVLGLVVEHAHDCDCVDREIVVDDTLKGQRHLEVLIHEGLHALFPAATEDQVEVAGRDLARWVWRHGYRRG